MRPTQIKVGEMVRLSSTTSKSWICRGPTTKLFCLVELSTPFFPHLPLHQWKLKCTVSIFQTLIGKVHDFTCTYVPILILNKLLNIFPFYIRHIGRIVENYFSMQKQGNSNEIGIFLLKMKVKGEKSCWI